MDKKWLNGGQKGGPKTGLFKTDYSDFRGSSSLLALQKGGSFLGQLSGKT